MKKLKILQVIPSFGVGGAEKLVLDYLTYFNKDNVEIKALSLYANQDTIYDKFIIDNNLDVEYLDKKPGMDFSIIRKIENVISKFNPDIVHTHLYTMKYCIFSLMKRRDINKYHTIHNEPIKDAITIDKFFNKIAFKYFGINPIALTDELAYEMCKYYGIKNSITIRNGINLDKFKNIIKDRDKIREELLINKDAFVIGHIGRFSEQKNHDFIIDVFNRLYSIKERSILVLVGDGELKDKTEKKVHSLNLQDKVMFLGQRNNIPEILKSMDVFLFPSLHEGFPISLIEAQAVGIRCVVSDKIDSCVILNEDTVSLSLDDDIDIWCKYIIDNSIKSNPIDNINRYDIKEILMELERIYRCR